MALFENKSLISYYNKMDNVLYEIYDQNGLPVGRHLYENWKEEVLNYLLKDGFIRMEGDFYVITSKGQKVIAFDDFLSYDRSINGKFFDIINIKEMDFSLNNFRMLLFVCGMLIIIVIWFLIK